VLHLLGGAALERGGVLVLARRASGFRPSDAVALSKALRPLGR
jgi:hypothetical protein